MFKKDKIINVLMIIVAIIIFSLIYGYFEEREYQEQKNFFINSCVKTFYYDNGYDLNELFGDFTEELPLSVKNGIENDFLGIDGSLAYLDEKKIENFCGRIYDFYKEDMEDDAYNYCDGHICR